MDQIAYDAAYFEERARAQTRRIEASMRARRGMALPEDRPYVDGRATRVESAYDPHRW